MHYERKGDCLEKLGKCDLAERAYKEGLQLEVKYLGEHHPLVLELREKLLMKRGMLEKTNQRQGIQALTDSFNREKHAKYLVRVGQTTKSAREYQYCLRIEKRVIGLSHPMVSQLVPLAKPLNSTI